MVEPITEDADCDPIVKISQFMIHKKPESLKSRGSLTTNSATLLRPQTAANQPRQLSAQKTRQDRSVKDYQQPLQSSSSTPVDLVTRSGSVGGIPKPVYISKCLRQRRGSTDSEDSRGTSSKKHNKWGRMTNQCFTVGKLDLTNNSGLGLCGGEVSLQADFAYAPRCKEGPAYNEKPAHRIATNLRFAEGSKSAANPILGEYNAIRRLKKGNAGKVRPFASNPKNLSGGPV